MFSRVLLILFLIGCFDSFATDQIYTYKIKKINYNFSSQSNPPDTSPADSTNQPIYSCFDPININTIGESGECEGKLIVDNNSLRSLVSNNLDYSHNAIFTGQVTDMSSLFLGNFSISYDITGWNTINVTTMESMFQFAPNFNQNISSWNTSNVSNMSFMFSNAMGLKL